MMNQMKVQYTIIVPSVNNNLKEANTSAIERNASVVACKSEEVSPNITQIPVAVLKPTKYVCPICHKQLPSKDSLKMHLMNDHTSVKEEDENREQGDMIPTSDPDQQDMDQRVPKEKRFPCNLCPKVLSKAYSLKQHLLKVHSNVGVLATNTNCNSGERANVERKVVSQDDVPNHHPQSKRPKLSVNQNFQCHVCSKVLSNMYHLKQHLLKLHAQEWKSVESTKLPKEEEKRKETDSNHSKVIKPRQESIGTPEAKNSRCLMCSKLLSSPYHLKRHMATVHGNKEELKKHPCPECATLFSSKSCLKRHCQRKHSKDKKEDTIPEIGNSNTQENMDNSQLPSLQSSEDSGQLHYLKASLDEPISKGHIEYMDQGKHPIKNMVQEQWVGHLELPALQSTENSKQLQCSKVNMVEPISIVNVAHNEQGTMDLGDTERERVNCQLLSHPHKEENQYKCNICSKSLTTKRSLQRHISSVHAKSKTKEVKQEITNNTNQQTVAQPSELPNNFQAELKQQSNPAVSTFLSPSGPENGYILQYIDDAQKNYNFALHMLSAVKSENPDLNNSEVIVSSSVGIVKVSPQLIQNMNITVGDLNTGEEQLLLSNSETSKLNVTEKAAFPCPKCQKSISTRPNLQRHMRTVHSEDFSANDKDITNKDTNIQMTSKKLSKKKNSKPLLDSCQSSTENDQSSTMPSEFLNLVNVVQPCISHVDIVNDKSSTNTNDPKVTESKPGRPNTKRIKVTCHVCAKELSSPYAAKRHILHVHTKNNEQGNNEAQIIEASKSKDILNVDDQSKNSVAQDVCLEVKLTPEEVQNCNILTVGLEQSGVLENTSNGQHDLTYVMENPCNLEKISGSDSVRFEENIAQFIATNLYEEKILISASDIHEEKFLDPTTGFFECLARGNENLNSVVYVENCNNEFSEAIEDHGQCVSNLNPNMCEEIVDDSASDMCEDIVDQLISGMFGDAVAKINSGMFGVTNAKANMDMFDDPAIKINSGIENTATDSIPNGYEEGPEKYSLVYEESANINCATFDIPLESQIYSRPTCDLRCESIESMQLHIEQIHDKSKENKPKKSKTDKRTTNKIPVDGENKLKQKGFSCSICQKNYMCAAHLNRHLKSKSHQDVVSKASTKPEEVKIIETAQPDKLSCFLDSLLLDSDFGYASPSVGENDNGATDPHLDAYNETVTVSNTGMKDINNINSAISEETAPHVNRELDRLVKSKIHPCPMCNKLFASVSLVRRHVARIHDESSEHSFEIRDPSESDSSDNSQDCKTDPKERVFRCAVCFKTFANRFNLNRHMKSKKVHENIISNNKKTESSNKYKNYVRNRKKSDVRQTSPCFQKLPCNQQWRECKICDYKTQSPTNYERHLGTIKHEENVKKRANDRKRLILKFARRLRQGTKSSIGRRRCIICNKSFSIKKNFTTHRNFRHQGLKPFRCPFCADSYAFPRSLDVHLIVKHTSLKLRKCCICNWNFTSNERLKSHLKNVHRISKFFESKDKSHYQVKVKSFKDSQSRGGTHQVPFAVYKVDEAEKQCQYCKVFCQSEAALLNHLKRHSNI